MADVPFYLQGTQTAGLFQQPMSGQPLYGQGQGMFAAPQLDSVIPGYSSMTPGAQKWAQNKLASIASGRDFSVPAGWNPAGLSSFSSQPGNNTSPTAPAADNSFGIYGQGSGDAWMTPEQLMAATNSVGRFNSSLGQGTTAGNSAGGMASKKPEEQSNSNGLLGNGISFNGAMPSSSAPSGISGFPTFNSSPLTNYMPNASTGQVAGQVGGQVPMMQAGPQNALNQYYNTAGYQLTNGPNAVNQFQTSPGYQFAVDQALGQVQRNAASRGLLDSGAGLRAMTDRAQGMANQEFNNWQQNQQAQYNQYQNRLAGLASGPTGADYAFQTGTGLSNNAMNTGTTIGSILANQGNSLFGGITGAAGAQAQNIGNAANMQAQIQAQNMQTQMMLAALAAGQRSN